MLCIACIFIRGSKLQAMLTSQLRGIELSILKKMCLEQLEGMSKKRIIAILNGKITLEFLYPEKRKILTILGEDMDESSDTSDYSDEEMPVAKANNTSGESHPETLTLSNYWIFNKPQSLIYTFSKIN